MKIKVEEHKTEHFAMRSAAAKGEWVNNHTIMKKDTDKPCHKLGHCPYGQLVEAFPLPDQDEFKCKVFGHHCPIFYHYEDYAEDD